MTSFDDTTIGKANKPVAGRSPTDETDLLSEVLSSLRVDSSALYVFDLIEPWGVELDELPFYVSWTVRDGTVWMLSPGSEPVLFHRGDTFLLPRGVARKPCVLASSPDVKSVRLVDLWREAEANGYQHVGLTRRPQHLRWGGKGNGKGTTRVISTAFSFNDNQLGLFLADLPEPMVVPASERHGEGDLIDQLLRFAADGEDTALPGFGALATQTAQLLLLLFIRTYVLSIDKGALGALAGLSDPQIGRALEGIHHEPERSWTVASLARAAGLSRSLFAERFLERVGQTPAQYLRAWRMHLAQEALSRGKISVAALARELGYQSEAAFRTAFRRTVGRVPRDFRRHMETQKMERLTGALSQGTTPAAEHR